MVRNLLSLGHPCVDVDMLVLCLWLESLADEHMIKLLAVRDISSLVEIPHVGDILEVFERLDKGKLIEVASDDDFSVLVFSEDIGNKFLYTISIVSSKCSLE